MTNPERDSTPVLITEAAPSYEDQIAARKRKYAIMMGARIPCLLLAMVFYQTWWLALALIALSVPLPWMAVLIANDRPPRKAEKANKFVKEHRAIEARPHQVIEG
ncbi:DUF3099 domain-containing protein [Saccharothrix sp. Mg75]|uniref:DUF3099 domain-containing protein n=1 Tax=Saccharothrix sp. Mg75 TaxID=3445357 RepID=UPI003EEACB21